MKIDPTELNAKKAHDILTDIVMPRPIAFVSTIGEDGIHNVAPYSYFTAISHRPMIVGFSLSRKKKGIKKDTLVNIEHTKAYLSLCSLRRTECSAPVPNAHAGLSINSRRA